MPQGIPTAEEEAIEDLGIGGLGDILVGAATGGLLLPKLLLKKGIQTSGKQALKQAAEWGAPLAEVGGVPLPLDPGFYKAIGGRPGRWVGKKVNQMFGPEDQAPKGWMRREVDPNFHMSDQPTRVSSYDPDFTMPSRHPMKWEPSMTSMAPSPHFESVMKMVDNSPLRKGFSTELGPLMRDRMKTAVKKGAEAEERKAALRANERDALGFRLPVSRDYKTPGEKAAAAALEALAKETTKKAPKRIKAITKQPANEKATALSQKRAEILDTILKP
jgi:hypothetical protein